MNINDFDYLLPPELIAVAPALPRDHSRLMVLNKTTGATEHQHFYDLVKYLKSGDLLVVNNSKVFPARLIGRKELTGGKVEIFLERELESGRFEAIGRHLEVDMRIIFDKSSLEATVSKKSDELYTVIFSLSGERLFEEFSKIGEVPLPPYIKRQRKTLGLIENEGDTASYQTVYAKDRGSVAAPTAGLHFTPELMEKIKKIGVEVLEITLHVGLGTFAPVKAEKVEEHKIHAEYFSVKRDVLEKIIAAKKEERRIIAVGTTTTRTLEHIFGQYLISNIEYRNKANNATQLEIRNCISGFTEIYIYPGYHFKCVDAMITNFHLPKSTLLLLISAFAGKDKIDAAYKEAIKEKYRFYSYGDAMLII